MKAVFIRKHGGNEVLEFGDMSEPVPGRGEVLIRVRAAAVNPRDWMIRSGTYPFRFTLPPFPIVLGGDFAGEVAATGPDAGDFRIGERVYGMQRAFGGFGAFAQYVVARQSLLARIPPSLDFERAAAVPLAALTAWQALRDDVKLKSGDEVLVNGAAGGVGSFAVQLAVEDGARVTGVCSARNLEFVRALGANETVDYREKDFLQLDRRWNVICDAIGKETWSRCRSRLTPDGVYVTTVPKIPDLTAALLGKLSLARQRGARRCVLTVAQSRGDRLQAISRLIEKGRIRVPVEQVFDLDKAGEALARSRTLHTRGKLVLRIP
jgi:NADPH:quinone reductase-like Zn-dependent oxidoreductase